MARVSKKVSAAQREAENAQHCMINEMYSKDLSQKIQSCFRSKEARGEIYTPVPFGYKKDQKNHLVLDEEVSDVVVRIFLWKKCKEN